MHQLRVGSLPLPKLYVVDNKLDVEKCKANGIPYIVWHGSDEKLAKIVLFPTLKKLFPYINWAKQLGINSNHKNLKVMMPGDPEDMERKAVDMTGDDHIESDALEDDNCVSGIADDYRTFSNKGVVGDNKMLKLTDYAGDMTDVVNIEELQALHMLPAFLDDIATCVRKNIYSMEWWEGYNKKRRAPVGNFNHGNEADNLIILDVSASIPRGIAMTMLTLIDTLRTAANADLIITSNISKYYPLGTELPSPEDLRKEFGPGNEARMFNDILRKHIKGRTFGNVISFGDNDCPSNRCYNNDDKELTSMDMTGTKINKVWNYHTGHGYDWGNRKTTGYARWCTELCNAESEEFNTNWCNVIIK